MRYFVIESGVDFSLYDSLDTALASIEPPDIHCMRLFDERGNEYPLLEGRKRMRFLGIWPTTIPTTVREREPREATGELKSLLRSYAETRGFAMPPNDNLPDLVDLIIAKTDARKG